jgi:hypothetical protein
VIKSDVTSAWPIRLSAPATMVITDTQNQKTPLKAAPPNPGQSSSVPPPPPTYSAIPPKSEQAFYNHVRAPRQEPAGKRFCKAFGIAVLIWLLVAVIRSIIALSEGHHGRHGRWVSARF